MYTCTHQLLRTNVSYSLVASTHYAAYLEKWTFQCVTIYYTWLTEGYANVVTNIKMVFLCLQEEQRTKSSGWFWSSFTSSFASNIAENLQVSHKHCYQIDNHIIDF